MMKIVGGTSSSSPELFSEQFPFRTHYGRDVCQRLSSSCYYIVLSEQSISIGTPGHGYKMLKVVCMATLIC